MYIVSVRKLDFDETVCKVLSFIVRTVSVSIVLNFFFIDSFKSELSFFCLLLRSLT